MVAISRRRASEEYPESAEGAVLAGREFEGIRADRASADAGRRVASSTARHVPAASVLILDLQQRCHPKTAPEGAAEHVHPCAGWAAESVGGAGDEDPGHEIIPPAAVYMSGWIFIGDGPAPA